MKDLPGLVKGYGDNLLKNVANGYLSWRWAVKPMISDLRKLYNFTKAVDDRVTMLYKLRNGETLRRKVHLSTSEVYTPWQTLLVQSEGCGITGRFRTKYTMEDWGSAQWKLLPDSQLPMLGYGPLEQKAKLLTLGLTSYEALATAWELTPWSWLADWFGNTGDIIAACNNSVGCTWSNVCYMRKSEATLNCEMLPAQSDAFAIAGLQGRNYNLRMTRKERYVVAPVLPLPFPHLPILTSGQWSILAALAAQRL
jgi:hypothetical protein